MRKRKYGHLIWNDKTLEELEQEAIEYIQKIPLKEDKVFVGFSGGKDRELSKKHFPLMWKVHKRYAKEYYYMKEKTRGPWDKPFEEWYNNYWIN